MKTNFPYRTPTGSRPLAPRQPAPSVTAPSGRSLPFAVASTVPRPASRRAASPGLADELKTRAPRASLRGEHGRALDLYRTLSALEPSVPLHRIRAGDCLVKLGKRRDALVEYRVAAEAYVALGMQVHARSAWRLVLGIVPGDADAIAHLAALDTRVRGAVPGTPPPIPSAAGAIPAPPAPEGAPSLRRARGSGTPTAPESEIRADADAARLDVRTTLAPEPVKALATTPVVPRRADLRERSPAGAVVVAKAESFVPSETSDETERVLRHAALALEFADLDEDEDRIWIDLEGLCGPAPTDMAPSPMLLVLEESEPVAFFAEMSDPGPVRPESVLGAAPRASLIDEQTKPVPPPDE